MKKYKKKIFIITGNRSDYDLLFWLLKEIKKNKLFFEFKLIVTGNHFSNKYGSTYKNIKKDGINIYKTIKLSFNKDNLDSLIKNISTISSQFNKIIKSNKPDLILLLGDRYEILPVAFVSMFNGIPICHLNGGENTSNSFDDYIRNCITKLSYFHFPAHKLYAKNIIQMGEDPKRVFMTGGLSENQVKSFKLLSKKKISKDLDLNFNKNNILITYHPETIEKKDNKKNFKIILKSLMSLKEVNLFFTYPNSDPESQIIINELRKAKKKLNKSCKIYIFKTLGRSKYLSLMKYSDLVVGNSSSGILEAPLMNKISLNIGSRQDGRVKAATVIDCKADPIKLKKLLISILNGKYRIKNNIIKNKSPAKEIVKKLKMLKIPDNIKKEFYNI